MTIFQGILYSISFWSIWWGVKMILFCRADSALSFGVLWSHFQSNFHIKNLQGTEILTFWKGETSQKILEPPNCDKGLLGRSKNLYSGVTFHALSNGIFSLQSQNFSATSLCKVGWWSRGRSLKALKLLGYLYLSWSDRVLQMEKYITEKILCWYL